MLLRMPYTTAASDPEALVDVEKAERRASVATDVDLPRSKSLPYLNVKPVPGLKHPQAWDALVRFGLTWQYVAVAVPIVVYCFTWYWWILCLITMIPSAYADYSAQTQGLFFIGLILGTLFSEVCCSGTLSDWIVTKLAQRNHGLRVAEMRLWLVYPAATLTAVGLILWGVSIDQAYHWIVGQVAFFLVAAGIQMANTIVAAYVCDAYPLQSMSVITFYAVMLNLSAFVSPFFIAPWVAADGYTWAFAAQGIITFFGGILPFALLHWKGGQIRAKQGLPDWVNSEFDSIL